MLAAAARAYDADGDRAAAANRWFRAGRSAKLQQFPEADDWLRQATVPVRRVDAAEAPTPSEPALFMVGDSRDPTLQALLPQLERKYDDVRFLPCHGHLAGCLEAVNQMCEALATCSKRRGIVVVRIAAIVGCVANRFANVRAAIVSKPSALFDLQRRLGVNLLILEPERMSLRQMRATIDGFLTGKTDIDPIVESALASLPASVGQR